ncbi:hypothetical protein L5D93_24440 [Paenibacillus thiaminolyticus]|nr:hypothetical protein [Paenibacillus thiaminolyticus]
MYRLNPPILQACPLRTQCTESKDAVKRIKRHVWAEYVEEADHFARQRKTNECMRSERGTGRFLRVDTLKCPQKIMSIKSRRGIFHSGSPMVLNNSIRIGTRLNEILFFRYPLFFNFGHGHPITYWNKQ